LYTFALAGLVTRAIASKVRGINVALTKADTVLLLKKVRLDGTVNPEVINIHAARAAHASALSGIGTWCTGNAGE